MTADLLTLLPHCESKIEESLLRALAEVFEDTEEAGMTIAGLEPREYSALTPLDASGSAAHLIPQAVIEGADLTADWTYRVDFLLVLEINLGYRKCFAIECDGYEWHEKTKVQVARDKLRDRRMILDGIVPIRFSGSEIYRAADECARYIRSLAHATLGDVMWAEYQAKGWRA